MFLLHGETFEGLEPTDLSWIFKCEFSRQLLQGQVGFKSTPHAVFLKKIVLVFFSLFVLDRLKCTPGEKPEELQWRGRCLCC